MRVTSGRHRIEIGRVGLLATAVGATSEKGRELMAAHHRKAVRELEDKLGYVRTEEVEGFPVWRRDGFSPVVIDPTTNKNQVDNFMASVRRAHRPPPKVNTDVVSKADQAAFDAREKARKQQERADAYMNRNRLLGGASRGLSLWQLDQLEAGTEDVLRRDQFWKDLMRHRPFADITD
jgi:hypothetical protein